MEVKEKEVDEVEKVNNEQFTRMEKLKEGMKRLGWTFSLAAKNVAEWSQIMFWNYLYPPRYIKEKGKELVSGWKDAILNQMPVFPFKTPLKKGVVIPLIFSLLPITPIQGQSLASNQPLQQTTQVVQQQQTDPLTIPDKRYRIGSVDKETFEKMAMLSEGLITPQMSYSGEVPLGAWIDTGKVRINLFVPPGVPVYAPHLNRKKIDVTIDGISSVVRIIAERGGDVTIYYKDLNLGDVIKVTHTSLDNPELFREAVEFFKQRFGPRMVTKDGVEMKHWYSSNNVVYRDTIYGIPMEVRLGSMMKVANPDETHFKTVFGIMSVVKKDDDGKVRRVELYIAEFTLTGKFLGGRAIVFETSRPIVNGATFDNGVIMYTTSPVDGKVKSIVIDPTPLEKGEDLFIGFNTMTFKKDEDGSIVWKTEDVYRLPLGFSNLKKMGGRP